MTESGKAIKGLDEVWEYISKNVKDISSRKCRMMDKVAAGCNLLKEQEEEIKEKNARIWQLLCEKEQ